MLMFLLIIYHLLYYHLLHYEVQRVATEQSRLLGAKYEVQNAVCINDTVVRTHRQYTFIQLTHYCYTYTT